MVTIYQNFYTMQPHHVNIDVALYRIRSGKSRELVKWVSDATGEEYTLRKKKLPCILFAGQFDQRAINGLIHHSGFICLDFDKFPDVKTMQFWRDTIEGDVYTYAIFTSPSGVGLKVIVRIQPTDYKGHKAYFKGLKDYYQCEYFDSTVFDVSRICFESYDPLLSINHDSQIWTGQIFDPEPILIPYNKASLSEQETVRRLLKWSDTKYPIVPGYRNAHLYKLCCALNDFGIEYDYALSVVSAFQADDFRMGEIEVTLKSAYRKVNKFGSVKF